MPFCRNCGSEYEGAAKFCPECGQPQSPDVAANVTVTPQEKTQRPEDEPEEVLWEGESKSLTNRMSSGRVVGARYRLTNTMLYFREGLISTTTQQIPLWAVRDIDVREGMLQKTRGMGDIIVHVEHSDYTGRNTVEMRDVEQPGKVAQLLNEQAQRERFAYQQRMQTRYYGR